MATKPILTNLPLTPLGQANDSAARTKLTLNQYGDPGFEFNSSDVTAAIGFLESKGFQGQAAIVTASVLLNQAKVDNIPVYQLLETLKGFEGLELSALVGKVLNNNRTPTSVLGYRVSQQVNSLQNRNILA
jgi:hypothetical protein